MSYGEDQYNDLSVLRAVVWEIAEGRCEHPLVNDTGVHGDDGRCTSRATELAHIVPRGMGGSRYRNTVNNTMAACPLHARSTDNLSSPEWDHVPKVPLSTKREALTTYLVEYRRGEGWAI